MKKIITMTLILFVLSGSLFGCFPFSLFDEEETESESESGPESNSKSENNFESESDTEDKSEYETSDEMTANPETDFYYGRIEDKDAVYIDRYVGTSENVVIPSTIDGKPVLELRATPGPNASEEIGIFEGQNIKSVVIPDTVTSIGHSSFENCQELLSVKVPNSLVNIGTYAFYNCTKLEYIDLSETQITVINRCTFYGCTNLTQIKFPKNLLSINEWAFGDCSSLISIDLPDNIETIYENAFKNCSSINTITIPTKLNLVSIHGYVFYSPNLERIVFAEGRTEINGYGYFAIDTDAEIVIPNTVTKFSATTFIIKETSRFIFEGNCPDINDNYNALKDSKIYYHSDMEGWDTCTWKDTRELIPIEP